MRRTEVEEPTRRNKPWPGYMDYIYEANMIDGTIRFVAGILIYVGFFGSFFWYLLR
jgi:hypothetical protein